MGLSILIQKFKKLFNKDSRFLWLAGHGFYKRLNDAEYLKRFYKAMMHKELQLENPVTYNEKLQWLKLYDRKDYYTKMVDKYEAKIEVAKLVGEEYIIPTLGVWEKFDDIDFGSLPQQFVLKCTHDSGGLVICKNKESFDIKKAKKIINRSLKNNYYYLGREWPYKNVKPRIIAEQYMEDSMTKELRDYKFFCFDGVVKGLFVATDRQKKGEKVKFDYFDENYIHLDCKQSHDNNVIIPEKPKKFKEMLKIASILSKNTPQVRVDLYEVNGKVFFGEFTLFHYSGVEPFHPDEWDYYFGSFITLPPRC